MIARRVGRIAVAAFALLVVGAVIGIADEQADSATLSVFVSILPQQYFVERIGGDTVAVSVLVPPGQGPATYEPTPQQVVALGGSDLYLTIGVPFEDAFVPRIESNLPNLPILDTSHTIEKRSLEGHSHDEGDDHHDEGDDHEGGSLDPHVWLGPDEVKQQIAVIYDALVVLAPEHRALYRANYDAFIADIDALKAELTGYLAPISGGTFYVFHPAFGYFGDAFGLTQKAIETGGDEPTPARLASIIEEARADEVRVVFVQAQFSTIAATRVAEAIGGAVVQVNPLDPDWLENMRRIATALSEGLR